MNYLEGKRAYGFDHLVSHYFRDDEYTSFSEEDEILSEYHKDGELIRYRYRIIDYRMGNVPHEPLIFGSLQWYDKIPMTPDPECDEYIEGIGEIEYPIDCELVESLRYKNGLLHGKQTYWKEKIEDHVNWSWEDGNREVIFYKFCEENYLNGKKDGIQCKWDENEKLIEEENFQKGQKHGRQYYWKNGKIERVENYSRGMLSDN
ncbi:MAG: hypothetical protein RL086_730 [Bacteroidota bacterium]